MAGSVVSSKPEQMALRTAPLSSLPETNPQLALKIIIFLLNQIAVHFSTIHTSILSVVYDKGWQYSHVSTGAFANL